MSVFYKRITFVVADLERSLKIYKDILGFTIDSIRSSSEGDSYSYPVFRIPKEATLTFAALNSPEQDRILGLTEVKGYDLPKHHGIHRVASVIKVANLKSVMQQLKSLGLDTTELITENKKHISFIEQSFVDFDGHLIVLYEVI